MKKTILLGIAAVGVLLSSCLGDNDTTVNGSNAFGVVKKISNYDGNVLALSTGNYIIWDDLKDYELNEALTIASYKFSSGDIVAGNVIKASYINVAKEFPVNQQKSVTVAAVDTSANVKAGIGATSIGIAMYDVGTFFSNRMFMEYTVDKTKSEIYDISFVYDGREKMQIDAKGQPLKDGYRVLDVILTKRGDDAGTKESVATAFVGDMTNLRNALSSLGQKRVVIGFRYSEYNKTTKECKLVYRPEVFAMDFES